MSDANTRILVIDDDIRLGQLLKDYLSQFGFDVSHAETPERGLQMLAGDSFALLVLDVMLPGMDGFEVLRKLRADRSSLPIIMLTARGDVMDKVLGLEMGADDYLPKPFEPRELVARIQTVLRRQQNAGRDEFDLLVADGLELDLKRREGVLDKQLLALTNMEYELLRIFMLHAQTVLDRDQLMNELRGVDWDATNRAIDVSISRLRHKLGDDNRQTRFIKTVWGKGYQFVLPVSRQAVS